MKLLILMSLLTSLILPLPVSNHNPSASAQTVPSGECNCVLDSTTYASMPANNLTGLTIPGVDLLKNETLVSETEGNLSWITKKDTELLGVLSEDYFLGNFSRGTGKTVALNTLDIQQNEVLGIDLGGGSLPDQMKAEIIQASVDRNGTLGEIKTAGPKVAEIPIVYDSALEGPTDDKNRLDVSVPGPGDYLLLIELSYNGTNPVTPPKPLTLVYETVLVAN
ncbi:MAG TPA: hypothetical protein VE130_00395 [Nitrososphaeraceae archaeon]|nr:hypothetical protein [Nitrososphaeraceae archaeon]